MGAVFSNTCVRSQQPLCLDRSCRESPRQPRFCHQLLPNSTTWADFTGISSLPVLKSLSVMAYSRQPITWTFRSHNICPNYQAVQITGQTLLLKHLSITLKAAWKKLLIPVCSGSREMIIGVAAYACQRFPAGHTLRNALTAVRITPGVHPLVFSSPAGDLGHQSWSHHQLFQCQMPHVTHHSCKYQALYCTVIPSSTTNDSHLLSHCHRCCCHCQLFLCFVSRL